MPLKLNVAVSRKLGLPAYSSLGASCSVEVELDQSLVFGDLPGFHQRVEQVYTACRDAVAKELARQQDHATLQAPNDGSAAGPADCSSNGHADQRASQKQISYIKQLATQIHGLGVRRLEDLIEQMFGSPLAELSSPDASELIDLLKRVKNGKLELNSLLDGDSAERHRS